MSAFGNANDFAASYWPNTLFITSLTASMAVNTLVTGMIVFRILKVTGASMPTSVVGGRRTRKECSVQRFLHVEIYRVVIM